MTFPVFLLALFFAVGFWALLESLGV